MLCKKCAEENSLPDAVKKILATGEGFSSGVSKTFEYLKNPEKAPNMGSTYGQDIEPTGFYCLYYDGKHRILPHLQQGTATVQHPLVLQLGSSVDGTSWKTVLSTALKSKGRALTRKLLSLGYDAIVTVDGSHVAEIVLLVPAQQIQK